MDSIAYGISGLSSSTDMAESATGKNSVKAALGENLYHTTGELAEQANYLTDEKLANKLNNASFFDKDWSKKEIIEYTQEAYNTLRSQGKRLTVNRNKWR